MRVLDIAHSFSHELASKEAALALFKDEVIVYPTDTIYGLGVNALSVDAIDKLFAIKQRPADKAIPVIVRSYEMAKALALIGRWQEKIIRSLWPGPYTFVLPKRQIVPARLTAGDRTVALRLPSHAFCESLLADFEGPITATSANISGEEPLSTAREIADRFAREENQPDIVIDAGFLPETHPSTIIDLTGATPTILRVNPTTKDKLLEILKKVS